MRTQTEIADRLRVILGDEKIFDFRPDPLFAALDAEHAREFAKPDADLTEHQPEDVVQASNEYLVFAFGKALDHRGISANRSVQKLSEWAWLRGRDELAGLMRGHDTYPQYGVPALVLFATAFDLPIPEDPELARMAKGEPCADDCREGCGS